MKASHCSAVSKTTFHRLWSKNNRVRGTHCLPPAANCICETIFWIGIPPPHCQGMAYFKYIRWVGQTTCELTNGFVKRLVSTESAVVISGRISRVRVWQNTKSQSFGARRSYEKNAHEYGYNHQREINRKHSHSSGCWWLARHRTRGDAESIRKGDWISCHESNAFGLIRPQNGPGIERLSHEWANGERQTLSCFPLLTVRSFQTQFACFGAYFGIGAIGMTPHRLGSSY